MFGNLLDALSRTSDSSSLAPLPRSQQRAVHSFYFEYSSTINCSFTGALMSSRFGNASTRPLRLSRSTSSQPTTGGGGAGKRAPPPLRHKLLCFPPPLSH